jgi:transposase
MKNTKSLPISDEIKYKVVMEYLNTDATQEELMVKYNFGGRNISKWMRKFGLKSPDSQTLELNRQMAKEVNKTPKERELEHKIKELEKALDYEKLRTRALETMIDIAENDLKIPIRKKPGTKQ